MEVEIIHLTKLKAKQKAVVIDIQGGDEVSKRLGALGIRPGRELTMISSHFWRGPVSVIAGKTKIAIGHGMAHKIMVEVL